MSKRVHDKRGRKGIPEGVRQRAVERMQLGERVTALAGELGVHRSLLYLWKRQIEGKPPYGRSGESETAEQIQIRSLQAKIGQLEAVIGRKSMELDFFGAALRRVEDQNQEDRNAGGKPSMNRSGSGRRKAN